MGVKCSELSRRYRKLIPGWFLSGFMMVFYSLGAGCGQPPKNITSVDQSVVTRYGMLLGDEPNMGDDLPARVRFRSFKKEYLNAEVSLGISLGWLGFGTAMKVNTEFLNISSGGVFLTKSPIEQDSGIFLDDEAALDVRTGEEFKAECVYDSSFDLQYDGEAEISFGGSGVHGKGGIAKIMMMEVFSKTFDVQAGDNLQKLEGYCQGLFESHYRLQVKRDLARGVKSQMVIYKHFDKRIQALEKILGGHQDRIFLEGRVFNVSGVVSETLRDGSIKAIGVLDLGQGWSKRSLSFEHFYTQNPDFKEGQGSRMQLASSALLPRSVDDDYGLALLAAGYVARNQAEYAQSVKDGTPFTINNNLLQVQ